MNYHNSENAKLKGNFFFDCFILETRFYRTKLMIPYILVSTHRAQEPVDC